jgi:peroxiredoxin
MTASRGQWIAVGIILTILGGALTIGVALSDDLFPVAVGSRAPGFEAVNIANGDTVGLADYQGDVMLLNIWATWCAPCRQEMPSMERLYQELGPEGLRVVAISVDDGDGKIVQEFVDEFALTFEILHDPTQRVELTYQTTGVPESFVIDRHGVIVKKEIGAVDWDQPAQQALVRRLLADDSEEESQPD